MKILISGSTILLLFFFTTFEGGLSSCTKDKTIYDTVTVTHIDTLVIKDTALTTEILTDHPWEIQEIRGTVANSIQYYLRGGSNNTENFDNEYIVFNADGTGLYVENAGRQDSITWNFSNTGKTSLEFTLYDVPVTFTITWDNIRYKNKNLYFDEYYSYVDGATEVNAQKQTIRIPK